MAKNSKRARGKNRTCLRERGGNRSYGIFVHSATLDGPLIQVSKAVFSSSNRDSDGLVLPEEAARDAQTVADTLNRQGRGGQRCFIRCFQNLELNNVQYVRHGS